MEEFLICAIHGIVHVTECHVDVEGDYVALYDQSIRLGIAPSARRFSLHLRSFYDYKQLIHLNSYKE